MKETKRNACCHIRVPSLNIQVSSICIRFLLNGVVAVLAVSIGRKKNSCNNQHRVLIVLMPLVKLLYYRVQEEYKEIKNKQTNKIIKDMTTVKIIL